MYAIEFQAPIKNGIVHIPKQYQEIHDTHKATFVVMYESVNSNIKKNIIKSQLNEFHRLRDKSNNKIEVTMEFATTINEMVDDGIF